MPSFFTSKINPSVSEFGKYERMEIHWVPGVRPYDWSQFRLCFGGVYAQSLIVGADIKILHIDGEIAKLRDDAMKPGANAQKIQDRIEALEAARNLRLKELGMIVRSPEQQ